MAHLDFTLPVGHMSICASSYRLYWSAEGPVELRAFAASASCISSEEEGKASGVLVASGASGSVSG